MSKVKNTEKKGFKLDMQKALAPAALVILYVLFAIVGNNFFSLDTAKNILESSYYIGLMAFGVTFIIITGGIDLSLGTVMMCSALLGAYTFKQGWPLLLSVILTILVGVLFGFLNGNMIAKLKLPPFIATLGTQYVSMGIGSIITKVQSQTWPTATAEVGGWFKKVVNIFYRGVKYALAMHGYLYLIRIHAEKMHRLNDLKALVHKSCAVNGNLLTHLPGGVRQRVSKSHRLKLTACLAKEGATGCGKDYPLYLFPLATLQGLENSRVLAVDRDDLNPALTRRLHNYVTGNNERLLVGKGKSLAALDYRK